MSTVGLKEATALVKDVAKSVPAYSKYLKKRNYKITNKFNEKKFEDVPLTSKETYIKKFEKKELYRKKSVPEMMYVSSGSSGRPTYWYSSEDNEERDGRVHQYIFEKVFGISKQEKTLVVVCFAMGLWIAGVYTLFASRFMARNGFNITTITPGVDKEHILKILDEVAPSYDTVVLAGYPPFMTDIVNVISRKKAGKYKLKILTGGDKFTEDWRKGIIQKLKNKLKTFDIVNIYGSSDAAVLGHETQLSIFLRSHANTNAKLFKDLFGDEAIIPGFFQFNPKEMYIENMGQELVFTTNGSVPLVRYNIHDIGYVLTSREIKKILEKHRLLEKAKKQCKGNWSLPFVVVKGRTDVALTYYALNIYPEHIINSLNQNSLSKLVSTNYVAYTQEVGKNQKEVLTFEIELKNGVRPTKANEKVVSEHFTKQLQTLNMEYCRLCELLGKSVLPKIILKESGKLEITRRGVKSIAYMNGRKPKVLLKWKQWKKK